MKQDIHDGVSLRLSMAALGANPKDGRTTLCCNVDGKEYCLASLTKNQCDQVALELMFTEPRVTFIARGPNSIFLTGNLLVAGDMDDMDGDSDEMSGESDESGVEFMSDEESESEDDEQPRSSVQIEELPSESESESEEEAPPPKKRVGGAGSQGGQGKKPKGNPGANQQGGKRRK
jgi:hypothetical protein